ncbi:MAG: dTMP kinase [Chlamydiales bacterium]|nr:dTMP kinase [Chlamydiales bacterium]
MGKRALFITFEGGDGAGKTTLITKVDAYLRSSGHPVLLTRAPGGTTSGKTIRSLLLDHSGVPLSHRSELFLFLADRAQHVDEVILPSLERKEIVLCDRFNDSTIAYQSGARGFSRAWVEKLCSFACNGLAPDLTLYLDIDPRIGLARASQSGGSKDRIESETLKFHRKIRKSFHRIAKRDPDRFHLLDASGTPESVFEQAREKIDAFLQSNR